MTFLAGRLIEEMRSGAEPETDPRNLTNKQILMLHQLLHAAKFSDPSGNHLSPAGIQAATVVSLAQYTEKCRPVFEAGAGPREWQCSASNILHPAACAGSG